MKQLHLFSTSDDESSKKEHTKDMWELFIDGASRNNPGPSGAGVYLVKNGEPVVKQGFYLGTKTNNQAEYLALLLGLFLLEQHAQPGDNVHIVSDSELLVKQVDGAYRVKNEQLKALHSLALNTIKRFGCHVAHVLRDQNTQADALANQGIDKKVNPPSAFLALLDRHGITL